MRKPIMMGSCYREKLTKRQKRRLRGLDRETQGTCRTEFCFQQNSFMSSVFGSVFDSVLAGVKNPPNVVYDFIDQILYNDTYPQGISIHAPESQ